MKNLMVYINPDENFDFDSKQLTKIQIDQALKLGWSPKDILLYTNFPFSYGPVNANIIEDLKIDKKDLRSAKIFVVNYLFSKNLIKKSEIYWLHDLNAFELEKITTGDIALGTYNFALSKKVKGMGWNFGSVFFKFGAKPIFTALKKILDISKIDEEKALNNLANNNKKLAKDIKSLSNSFNFTGDNLKIEYKKVDGQIKIAHFSPKSLNIFRGDNEIKTVLITSSLSKLFKYHRFG